MMTKRKINGMTASMSKEIHLEFTSSFESVDRRIVLISHM